MRYAIGLASLMLCFCTAQVEGTEQWDIPADWERHSYTLSGETIEVALPGNPSVIYDQIECDHDTIIISADCPTLREGEGGKYLIVAWHDQQDIEDTAVDSQYTKAELEWNNFEDVVEKILGYRVFDDPRCSKFNSRWNDFDGVIEKMLGYRVLTLDYGFDIRLPAKSIHGKELVIDLLLIRGKNVRYALMTPARIRDADESIDYPFFGSIRIVNDKE